MKMQAQVTGQGEPLVLVPGGLVGWLSWEPHAQRLSATRRVVRVQLLNVQFGLEGRALPEDYSVRTESEALANTIEDLGLKSPTDYVAWSYGGLVALDFALGHARRVRSLTLIEPPAIWALQARGPLDAEVEREVAILRTLRGDISEDQLDEFAHAVGIAPPGQSARTLPQWPLWSRHRQSLRNSPAVLGHRDNVARLRRFRRPVLLVKGTGSARFLHQTIDALAAQLPNAQMVEMPGGHAPQLVSMDRFLEALSAFQAKAA
ncbi:MAG: alpha/beta hydrolase [Chloroflexi bacterium]|nr:alpha/beta hydrolase [Chloroflexota bacterium]